jgi:predicted Zn-dependent protease
MRLAAAVAAFFVVALSSAPLAIAASGADIDAALRARLAREWFGDFLIDDIESQEYLNALVAEISGEKNILAAGVRGREVNALAESVTRLLFVFDGMWLFSESEGEFAGVIAHEIAHIRQNHSTLFNERAKTVTAAGVAALIASLLVKDQEVQEALILGGAGAGREALTGYVRKLEGEADAIGLQLLSRAGFDTAIYSRLWRRMLFVESGRGAPEYLRTHPVTEKRVAAITGRTRDAPSATRHESADFLLLREKARARYERPSERAAARKRAAAAFSVVSAAPEKIAALYGVLLAAADGANDAADESAAKQLRIVAGDNPIIARALAARLAAKGDRQGAKATLEKIRAAYPERIALAADYARLLAAGGEYNAVVALVGSLPPRVARHPALRRVLSGALAARGDKAESHIALAEGYVAGGSFEAAERQLNIALQLAGGAKKSAKYAAIKGRLEEIGELVAELKRAAE